MILISNLYVRCYYFNLFNFILQEANLKTANISNQFLFSFVQAGLELKENLSGGAPWPYGYPYPYDPTLAPYAFNG